MIIIHITHFDAFNYAPNNWSNPTSPIPLGGQVPTDGGAGVRGPVQSIRGDETSAG